MSDALTFPHDDGESTSSPPAGPRTCDPRGAPRQPAAGAQMTMIPPRSREAGGVGFTRQQSADFSLRPGGDGTTGSGSGSVSVDSDRYHPYHRQLGDARSHSAGRQASSSPSSSSSSSSSSSWDRFNGSVQSSFPEPQTDPVEPACFLSHGYPLYSASGALQHVSSRQYPHADQYNSSKFPLQSVSAQSHMESSAESVFPKPIYSYSLLIFLALRNSAAGRLPVSEIYGFMTQHFPYFKSAPDGWKNSVRHNLSLNKCFQKVEGGQQGAARKGCLWALNPAKVDRMQEELHKWRRKDPASVRRSMASPEDMDRLLGERPTRLRPPPSFASPALLSRVASIFGPASSCTPPQHRPPPSRRPQCAYAQPPRPCYPPPPGAAAPPFGPYSACGQQRPPVAMPTGAAGFHAAGAQDFLLEGGGGYEVDALDPSLTDLQLPGHLWDSLVFDPTSDPPDRRHQPGVPRVTTPEGLRSEGTDGGDEDEDVFDRHACLSGLHPAVCSGAESLAGFLTSCSTSISLI